MSKGTFRSNSKKNQQIAMKNYQSLEKNATHTHTTEVNEIVQIEIIAQRKYQPKKISWSYRYV